MNAERPMPLAPSKNRIFDFVDLARSVVMCAIALVVSAQLHAQNLYLENYTDCDFTVRVRYADVGCDYSSYPQYTPANVCNPNPGISNYSAPAQTQTSYTTPNGSQICSLNVYDASNNIILYCGCALVNCTLAEYDCNGVNISVDVTITGTTTVIKWY